MLPTKSQSQTWTLGWKLQNANHLNGTIRRHLLSSERISNSTQPLVLLSLAIVPTFKYVDAPHRKWSWIIKAYVFLFRFGITIAIYIIARHWRGSAATAGERPICVAHEYYSQTSIDTFTYQFTWYLNDIRIIIKESPSRTRRRGARHRFEQINEKNSQNAQLQFAIIQNRFIDELNSLDFCKQHFSTADAVAHWQRSIRLRGFIPRVNRSRHFSFCLQEIFMH